MTIEFKAEHIRNPLKAKSDNWQETADKWLCTINGVEFDYYTGIGHRKAKQHPTRSNSGYTFEQLSRMNLTQEGFKQLIALSNPMPPLLDDLLNCLVSDASASEMSFGDWCSDFGSDSDSIKALNTYHECQKIAGKLRKAKINIETERKRLENY